MEERFKVVDGVAYHRPEDIIRAYRMLTPEQVEEHAKKIKDGDAPVLFPCPPKCPPQNA